MKLLFFEGGKKKKLKKSYFIIAEGYILIYILINNRKGEYCDTKKGSRWRDQV